MSQLKFHFAGDIPVYSTSDSFEPDPGANGDLDGLFFPDMPWMVSADPVTGRIRDSVRARGRRAPRAAIASTRSASTPIGWCRRCARRP